MTKLETPVTIDLLIQYIKFKNISVETMQKLTSFCERSVHEAGEVLYREHEQSPRLYIVHSGQVDIQYLLPNGRRKTIDTLLQGDLMLWSAVVPPYKTSSIGVCRAKAELIGIDGEKLRTLCEEDYAFGYQLMCHVATVIRRRVQSARKQLIDLDN
ncbi:MAG: Crp/Fnr family transcriptional regulator [Planctomycetaceae bacterium]|nr:Crp/Fnr family transcriptional regulator [Planctomycetaceae bacterium]